jgi:DnaB-like helicase C terminal domain
LNDDLQKLIIAGLVTADPEEVASRYRFANAKLRDYWFDGIYEPIWRTIKQFYQMTGAMPDRGYFEEMLAKRTDMNLSRKVEYSAAFEEILEQNVDLGKFRFNVVTLGERWRRDALSEALRSALQINLGSLVADDTAKAGYDDAIEYLAENLNIIQETKDDQLSEGNITTEAADLLQEYQSAKGGQEDGILTGYAPIDKVTNGIHPGELMLIAGFTGEGKSQTTYNIAYKAAFEQGKNVLFGSAEVSRNEVRRHIAVRHSHNPKFGLDGGLNYKRVKDGTLTSDEELIYFDVLSDMDTGTYGELYLFPVPHRERVAYVENKLQSKSRDLHVDLVVIDYLGLLGSNTRRPTRREELNDILISAKRMATDAHGGDGVAVLSPWQISRTAWENAQETLTYTKTALAETAEAERSPDIVISLLRPSDSSRSQLKCQILKNRDGAEGINFDLYTDFTTCLVTDEELYGMGLF